MSIIDSYLDALLAGNLGLNKGNKQMSKIDTSVDEARVCEDKTIFTVFYRGKYYQYFTTKAGAEAYLEMLKNGEGPFNRNKAEAMP